MSVSLPFFFLYSTQLLEQPFNQNGIHFLLSFVLPPEKPIPGIKNDLNKIETFLLQWPKVSRTILILTIHFNDALIQKFISQGNVIDWIMLMALRLSPFKMPKVTWTRSFSFHIALIYLGIIILLLNKGSSMAFIFDNDYFTSRTWGNDRG